MFRVATSSMCGRSSPPSQSSAQAPSIPPNVRFGSKATARSSAFESAFYLLADVVRSITFALIAQEIDVRFWDKATSVTLHPRPDALILLRRLVLFGEMR